MSNSLDLKRVATALDAPVARVIDALRAACPGLRLTLVGSRANGAARLDSDYDIKVEIADEDAFDYETQFWAALIKQGFEWIGDTNHGETWTNGTVWLDFWFTDEQAQRREGAVMKHNDLTRRAEQVRNIAERFLDELDGGEIASIWLVGSRMDPSRLTPQSDWDFVVVGEDFDVVEQEKLDRLEGGGRIFGITLDVPIDRRGTSNDIIFSSTPPVDGIQVWPSQPTHMAASDSYADDIDSARGVIDATAPTDRRHEPQRIGNVLLVYEGFTEGCWEGVVERELSIHDVEQQILSDWTAKYGAPLESGWQSGEPTWGVDDIFYAVFPFPKRTAAAAAPLPDYAWIAPDGTLHPLTRHANNHPKWVLQHAKELGVPRDLLASAKLDLIETGSQLNSHAIRRGWARLTREGDTLWVEAKELSTAQRRALQDGFAAIDPDEGLRVVHEYGDRHRQLLPEADTWPRRGAADWPAVLDQEGMLDYLTTHGRDWEGPISYADAKSILQCRGLDGQWRLQRVPLAPQWRYDITPRRRRDRKPIVTQGPADDWRIIDGVHRAAEAHAAGEPDILAYVHEPATTTAPPDNPVSAEAKQHVARRCETRAAQMTNPPPPLPSAVVEQRQYTAVEIVAACLVLEAGGEADPGKAMTAVMNVIANRAGGDPNRFAAVCLQPKQFSCFNGDRHAVLAKAFRHPHYPLAARIASLAARGQLPDITGGAKHYYNPQLASPNWATGHHPSAVIGNHSFFTNVK